MCFAMYIETLQHFIMIILNTIDSSHEKFFHKFKA